jgi:hypothetical protein
VKFRFKPEDFFGRFPNAEGAAEAAQIALDKAIAAAPVVYGYGETPQASSLWNMNKSCSRYTHKAVLFNIEEIEKKPCEHEPSYTLSGITQDTLSNITQAGHSSILTNVAAKIVCSKCGITLKARWEAAE